MSREDGVHLLKLCGSVLLQVACLLAFNSLLHAQSATPTLSGTVTDATGSVVPNAVVKVENQGTGLERQMRSDEQGRYSFPQLPPGR